MSDSPLLNHLLELRNRLLRALVAMYWSLRHWRILRMIFITCWLSRCYGICRSDSQMIATDVAAPFFTPFKLTFVVALALAIPYLLWQLWAFIAPGLYRKEKRLVVPLLISSTLLFYAGIAFAYFVVLPIAMALLYRRGSWKALRYRNGYKPLFDFVLAIFMAFGIAFETPVAIILLIWSGVSTRESLARKRPYIIVGAFTVGMLLTPPDVISQTLLAIPMWLLFELGLQISRWYTPSQSNDKETR